MVSIDSVEDSKEEYSLKRMHDFIANNANKSFILRPQAGSALSFSVASLTLNQNNFKQILLLTESQESAQRWKNDLSFFWGDNAVVHYPEAGFSPYAELVPDSQATMHRLEILARLTDVHPPQIIVASLAAITRRVITKAKIKNLKIELKPNIEFGRDRLIRALTLRGFTKVPLVDDPGTFSARGGIVDLYPPQEKLPIRVEFFDEEIESIRRFDPISQRTLRKIDSVDIFLIKETIPDQTIDVRERILALADSLSHPTRNTKLVLDMISNQYDFLGAQAYIPAFFDLESFFNYLLPAKDRLTLVIDEHSIFRAHDIFKDQQNEAYRVRLEQNELAYSPNRFFIEKKELKKELDRTKKINISAFASSKTQPIFRLDFGENSELIANLQKLRSEQGETLLKCLCQRAIQLADQNKYLVLAAGGSAHVERFSGLLSDYLKDANRDHDVFVHHHSRFPLQDVLFENLAPGIHLCAGSVSEGFSFSDGSILLSHEDVFGKKTKRKLPKQRSTKGFGSLGQLQENEFVVHRDHGVGKYCGLVQKAVDNQSADYLLLEYLEGDRLYLPVYRLNQISAYVGADGGKPKLDKLGGISWQRKKAKVAKDVQRFSEELLQLYAQRAALSGHAYDLPHAELIEFEESFPFEETPDQARAIEEVIVDLQSEKPMDRLVCGDVGFGKTEVALRAAFVVAMAGKQVALIAPTTILVEQHMRTFIERFSPYPLNIESLSRFRKPKEAKAVIQRLAENKVDIVIGTHRLFSKDVRIPNLGLIIVDEEQRFGVKHKEELKRLKSQVEVLTLTATPIPRTLQLSMTGLREISIIATPPVDRLAIRTMISRNDEKVISEGIRRELARGGQVFFLHNEVQSIDEWAGHIADLVPEARVAIGHGQMDTRQLERIMLRFIEGEFDVLVCTTIIEAGLDIPRANTLFINRADRFGLSQLYQIRGRIGRGKVRAYCYLLIPQPERLKGDAKKRLDLLTRFSQLGSGFSIASYDLELRGAGDLLGGRQSGHIAALGFETYARLLEEAVAELKGEPIIRETDPDLQFNLAAYIPEAFVEDTGQRLELYKRFSDRCQDPQELHNLIAEIRDRYGPTPPEIDTYGKIMEIKGLGIKLGATLIDMGETRVTVVLSHQTPVDPQNLIRLVNEHRETISFSSEGKLSYRLAKGEGADRQLLQKTKQILHALLALS